jgi:hypothetical protein
MAPPATAALRAGDWKPPGTQPPAGFAVGERAALPSPAPTFSLPFPPRG